MKRLALILSLLAAFAALTAPAYADTITVPANINNGVTDVTDSVVVTDSATEGDPAKIASGAAVKAANDRAGVRSVILLENCIGNGSADDTACINAAITAAAGANWKTTPHIQGVDGKIYKTSGNHAMTARMVISGNFQLSADNPAFILQTHETALEDVRIMVPTANTTPAVKLSATGADAAYIKMDLRNVAIRDLSGTYGAWTGVQAYAGSGKGIDFSSWENVNVNGAATAYHFTAADATGWFNGNVLTNIYATKFTTFFKTDTGDFAANEIRARASHFNGGSGTSGTPKGLDIGGAARDNTFYVELWNDANGAATFTPITLGAATLRNKITGYAEYDTAVADSGTGNSIDAIMGATAGGTYFRNLGVGTTTQFGGGNGVVGIKDATTNPSTNPTGGGVLYCDSGDSSRLKWRRPDGTTDVVGAGGATINDSAGNGDTTVAWSADKVFDQLALKQDTLVSGTNIKTVGGTSLLGSGDASVSATPAGTVTGVVQVRNSAGTALTADDVIALDTTNHRLGIGTATPAQPIHMYNSGGGTQLLLDSFGGNTIAYRRTAGSVGSPSAASGTLGQFTFTGYAATGYPSASTASIAAAVYPATLTDSDYGTYLQFNATPGGSTTRRTVMNVFGNGVTIGDPASSTPPGAGSLSVSGSITAAGVPVLGTTVELMDVSSAADSFTFPALTGRVAPVVILMIGTTDATKTATFTAPADGGLTIQVSGGSHTAAANGSVVYDNATPMPSGAQVTCYPRTSGTVQWRCIRATGQ